MKAMTMTGGTRAVARLPAMAIGSKRRRALAVKAITAAGLAGNAFTVVSSIVWIDMSGKNSVGG